MAQTTIITTEVSQSTQINITESNDFINIEVVNTSGSQGIPGPGLPAGGTDGQIIFKSGSGDYDFQIVDSPYVELGSGVSNFQNDANYTISGSSNSQFTNDENYIVSGSGNSQLDNDSNYIESGSNITQLNNNANYTTSGSAISQFDNDSSYITSGSNISELTNDANYIESGSNISELNNDQNYIESGSNVSELNNDQNYITSGSAISQLDNDSGYLTTVTEEDVTQYEGALFISESQIVDLQTYQLLNQKGQANGYVPLDAGAKIEETYLPDSILGQVSYQGTYNATTNTPTLSGTPDSTTKGNYYVVETAGTQFTIEFSVGDWIISNGVSWQKVDNSDAVTTVFGRLGNILAVSEDYDEFYLEKTENLNDLPNKGTARTNLDVYSTTEVNNNFYSASNPSNFVSSGSGVSNFNNDAGYLTEIPAGVVSGSVLRPGDNISELLNDENYIQSGSNITELSNNANYITSGSDISQLNNDSDYIQSGSAISLLDNDVGYITDSGSNNYVNNVNFDTGSGLFTLDRIGLSSLSASFDGRYIQSGSNISIFNNDSNFVISGSSNSQFTNDVGYITDSGSNNYVDSINFDLNTGLFTTNRIGLSTLSSSFDGRYAYSSSLSNYQLLSEKGAANGYVPLNSSSLIDSQYLPSFVDDVLEYTNLASFPATGETGKLYVALDTNFIYRWSGSTYIQVGGGGAAEVDSVFGRTGAITAQVGDYSSFYVQKSGDTMTGNLIIDGGTDYRQLEVLREVGGVDYQGFLAIASGSGHGIWGRRDVTAGTIKYIEVGGTNPRYIEDATGYTLWHSGNDGGGSGLDADSVDGYQPSDSPSNNTLVTRNPSGYIYGNFINMGSSFTTSGASSGMGNFIGNNGSDTFARSYNATGASVLIATAKQFTESGDGLSGSFNDVRNSSLLTSINASANTPFGNAWYHLYQSRHRGGASDGSSWASQLVIGMTNYTNRIAFRTENSNNVWQPWVEVLTDSSVEQTKSGNFIVAKTTARITAQQDNARYVRLEGNDAGGAVVIGNPSGTNTVIRSYSNSDFGQTLTAPNFILTSDKRLKENIEDYIPNTLNFKWRKFDWKDNNIGKNQIGLIAQEVELINPEFVITNEEGYKSVKYIDLLVAKMAEKDQQIEDLTNRIERLEFILEKLL